MKRSKPLRRSRIERRSRLRPVSKKRRATAEQRRKCREIVIERDGKCKLKTIAPDVACWGPIDVHEVVPRGRGGDPLDPDNCLAGCRLHHDLVGANPKRATELGLLRRKPRSWRCTTKKS